MRDGKIAQDELQAESWVGRQEPSPLGTALNSGLQPRENKNSPVRRNKLRFEVNNQSYMLSFNNDDGRWYLMTAGVDGRMKAFR